MAEVLRISPHLVWDPDKDLLNCSIRSASEWAARGTKKPIQGFVTLLFGIATITIYIITLIAMSTKQYLKITCFKMMYFTSLCDIGNLFISNVVTGYYLIVGANFCTHPRSMYTFGAICIGCWGCMDVAATSLAIGRFVEVTDKCRWLFKEGVIKFWISFALLYFIFMAFFTYPMVFNSTEGVWMFAPRIQDNVAEEQAIFTNHLYMFSIYLMVSIITIIYICLFLFLIFLKYKTTLPVFTKLERNLFIQCAIICLLSNFSFYSFVGVLYFEAQPAAKFIAQFSYQIAECGPLLGYLIFNDSIRRRVWNIIRLRKPSHTESVAPLDTTNWFATTNHW